MEYKVIYHPARKVFPREYLLILDERENITIPYNGYFLLGDKINRFMGSSPRITTSLSKIILAHHPLNNSPVLEEVPTLPTLPELPNNIKILALKEYPVTKNPLENIQKLLREAFEKGAATKKYSEEDMREMFKRGMRYISNQPIGKVVVERSPETKEAIDRNLKSLPSSPIPVGFKAEMEITEKESFIGAYPEERIKMTGNQWVGEWIFKTE